MRRSLLHCLWFLWLSPLVAAASRFVPIFDGETLAGWEGDPRFWRVEEGAIVGETTESQRTANNTFLIWQGGEVTDFELKVEFRIRNHNSGIQYRSFLLEGQPWEVGGYQADFSADHKWTGAAWGEKYKKLLADRGEIAVVGEHGEERKVVGSVGVAEEILAHVHREDWNEYHIIARGNQCIQLINGVVTAEFTEASEDRLKRGLIALQLHAGPPMEVRFRNIRLRKLAPGDRREVLFLAGKGSHGKGAHEHRAGCHLLARCLHESGLDINARVVTSGSWPEPWQEYQKPDTVVMYCDGYEQHLAKDHRDKIQALVDQGVGVACLHFAVEVEPEVLGRTFLDWIGGFFEIGWSVNPFWDATFDEFPDHPVANGVEPFTIRDEWYYHMRFQPEMEGVTPILSALPPLRSLTSRSKDPNRGSNPVVLEKVTKGESQVVAWAYERPSGGRGFGFTGGHFHRNWQMDPFRRVVLNALVWTAGGEVPPGGVLSRSPSDGEMELNQDYPDQ